jgi:hypothetical protein
MMLIPLMSCSARLPVYVPLPGDTPQQAGQVISASSVRHRRERAPARCSTEFRLKAGRALCHGAAALLPAGARGVVVHMWDKVTTHLSSMGTSFWLLP